MNRKIFNIQYIFVFISILPAIYLNIIYPLITSNKLDSLNTVILLSSLVSFNLILFLTLNLLKYNIASYCVLASTLNIWEPYLLKYWLVSPDSKNILYSFSIDIIVCIIICSILLLCMYKLKNIVIPGLKIIINKDILIVYLFFVGFLLLVSILLIKSASTNSSKISEMMANVNHLHILLTMTKPTIDAIASTAIVIFTIFICFSTYLDQLSISTVVKRGLLILLYIGFKYDGYHLIDGLLQFLLLSIYGYFLLYIFELSEKKWINPFIFHLLITIIFESMFPTILLVGKYL